MRCRKVKVLLPDYLDGRIGQSERNELAVHIRHCRDCGEDLRFLTWYRKQLEETPRVNAPPDFLEQVTKKIAGTTQRGILAAIFSPPSIKIPLQAAALAAVILITVIFFRHTMRFDESTPRKKDLTQTLSQVDHKSRKGGADRMREEIATAPLQRQKEKISPRSAQPPLGRSPAKRVSSAVPASSPVIVYLSTIRPSSTRMKSEASNDNAPEAGKAMRSAREKKSDITPSTTISEFIDTDYIVTMIRKADGRIIRMDYDAGRGAYRSIVTELPAASCSTFMDALRSRWRVQHSSDNPCVDGSKVMIELHIAD